MPPLVASSIALSKVLPTNIPKKVITGTAIKLNNAFKAALITPPLEFAPLPKFHSVFQIAIKVTIKSKIAPKTSKVINRFLTISERSKTSIISPVTVLESAAPVPINCPL